VPSLLSTVRAQTVAVETLRRAMALGRVHHAYLFDGPDGVGKERTAFGLAQALVCELRGETETEACGVCKSCVRAVPRPGDGTPLHPDVVVLERGLYEPAAIGRRTPETQDISVDQVRTLVLARAAFAPHEGRAKVFIVRRADELSPTAANALLKTLEEPGARTHFVLLSSVGDSLLPTIRSRAQRVRFGPLPDDVVTELLAERGVERAHAEAIANLAGGSMATALVLSDAEASARRDEFVSRAMGALDAGGLSASLELAEDAKKVSRDALVAQIGAFAIALAAKARAAVVKGSSGDRTADMAAARHALALATTQQIDGNASAQLAVEAMLIKMRAV
jgi:DNA polymerase-3 subunit delta'